MGVWRVRGLITAPLTQVWEFIIDPRNMHLWGPLTEPVTGIDRPLQLGDRVIQRRRRFFRRARQDLLVEEIVPYRSFRLRILSPSGRPMNATATVSVEEAAEPGATRIEEAIAYSLGNGPITRWVDRWLVYPLFLWVVRRASTRAFGRLAANLSHGHEGGEAAPSA